MYRVDGVDVAQEIGKKVSSSQAKLGKAEYLAVT